MLYRNSFTISYRDPSSKARAGILQTPHGPVETPVFMPVGTQASVKTLSSTEVEAMGYPILLSNTYHLFLRPGSETLVKAGGLHKFMSWPKAILTDSGGYQVFSLATRCKLSEEGVEFSSHVDGARHHLSPEITTNFQLDIGSDIAMCLDDCPPYPSLESDARASLERTTRWAGRCKESYVKWLRRPRESGDPGLQLAVRGLDSRLRGNDGFREDDVVPLLFGISQGAHFPELRRESTRRLAEIGFPGYAVGGLGIGEPKELMWELLEASLEEMPDEAPHYMMGIGQPEDMWDGVERGVDMFDCVLPTRNGRNGQAFTSIGCFNITNSRFREDFGPLDPSCGCPACRTYTRAYLCHLFRTGELLGPRLVTLHNLSFMIGLLRQIRSAIVNGNFQTAKQKFFQTYNPRRPKPVEGNV